MNNIKFYDYIDEDKIQILIDMVAGFLTGIITAAYEECGESVVEDWEMNFRNFVENSNLIEIIDSYLVFKDNLFLSEEDLQIKSRLDRVTDNITSKLSVDIRELREKYREIVVGELESKVKTYFEENLNFKKQLKAHIQEKKSMQGIINEKDTKISNLTDEIGKLSAELKAKQEEQADIENMRKKLIFTENLVKAQKDKLEALNKSAERVISGIPEEQYNKLRLENEKNLEALRRYTEENKKVQLDKDSLEKELQASKKKIKTLQEQLEKKAEPKKEINIREVRDKYGEFHKKDLMEAVTELITEHKDINNIKDITNKLSELSRDLHMFLRKGNIQEFRSGTVELLEKLKLVNKDIYNKKHAYVLNKIIENLREFQKMCS